jgi:hypothetical protein
VIVLTLVSLVLGVLVVSDALSEPTTEAGRAADESVVMLAELDPRVQLVDDVIAAIRERDGDVLATRFTEDAELTDQYGYTHWGGRDIAPSCPCSGCATGRC